MVNPLLSAYALPPFNEISIADFEPAIDQVLADSRALIDKLLSEGADTWEDLVYPLESADDRLNRVWAVISLYNGVLNSDAVRETYKKLLGKLTQYQTEIGQNQDLYQAYQRLHDSEAGQHLGIPQRKALDNTLRNFKLSGVGLNDQDKQTYTNLKQTLSSLTNHFSENVLDATQGWTRHIVDVSELQGLPESALALFSSLATQHNYDAGYLLTLDAPCFQPVMTYCDNRDLREQMYQAFITRASDQGPHAGKWDNSDNIQQIMITRQKLAVLLSFDHYAERSLATKMASSVDEVVDFLEQLAVKSLPVARQQFDDLQTFVSETYGLKQLEMWDIAYYSEKLRQQLFDISQEQLKPYFPASIVVKGLFQVVHKLFEVDIEEDSTVQVWHPDVRFFRLCRDGEPFAGFYLDMFARKGKRGGAWMSDCRVRRRLSDGSLQQPLAFLTCNFTPPVDGKDSLLTHSEVTTLFHEFGHGLHHMLSKIDVSDVSGISGVPWDVVELPSQFLENWCWQEESIRLISAHHETGESLPKILLEKMLRAKHFQSAMQMMRQLEFALFDILLHRDFSEASNTNVLALLESVQQKVSVKIPPGYARFSHSFSHIFAGGYAAGYYSYKWAEVLAADAFSKFEEAGIFNQQVGREFREKILEVGGSLDAMDMFVDFRGRKPSVEPLLIQSGIEVRTVQ